MKLSARLVEALLLACLLALVLPLAMSLRSGVANEPDTRENLLIALNLLRFGVYSVQEAEGSAPPPPTTKREPLYPTLLAAWMAIFRDESSFTAPPTLASLDPGFVRRLKGLNVLLHLLLVLASWWSARTFFGRSWPALAAAALVAFNSSMLSTVDVFLTEIPGALLLACSSALIYLSYARKNLLHPILGGLSLGALALTKAVYFYFVALLLAAAVIWLAVAAIRKSRRAQLPAFRWAILALAALAAYSPWFVRNQRLGQALQVDKRGEDVLAIRAEYSTMSWRQYAASFFYFTPAIGPRLATALFGGETIRSLDRADSQSFFRQAIEGTGEVQKVAAGRHLSPRQASIRIMAEHLPMMALLTLPFAYQGAFVQVGYNVRRVPAFLLYLTLVYSIFFVPALIILTVRLLRSKDPRWPFLVPALYTYAFYSLITHFIPRYSVPLVPLFIIALVSLTGWKHEADRTDPLPE